MLALMRPNDALLQPARAAEAACSLRLLSRFDLTTDQATCFYQPTERSKAGLHISDAELLANPYLIYELSRLSA